MADIEEAILIATQAHKGQKDKYGSAYIMHPMRVMMLGRTDEERICGILHDVVEDTPVTFEDLQKEGFSTEIIEALRCVTKTSEDEDYDEFIQRTLTNPLAVRVKLNDLTDNMDLRRMKDLKENDLKRLNKYLRAYHLLLKEMQK